MQIMSFLYSGKFELGPTIENYLKNHNQEIQKVLDQSTTDNGMSQYKKNINY